VSRRQAQRWAAQEPAPYQEPQYAAPPPPGGGGESRVEKLKDLAALKEQGVLSEEEFASEKARILAS
jgi:Short C-terminal domain